MKRTIKLLLYFFAYQLAFASVFTLGYMWLHHLDRMPTVSDAGFMEANIVALAGSSVAITLHLILGRYVSLQEKIRSAFPGLFCLIALLFIVAMGCWTNYVNELLSLPDNNEAVFAAMMDNPLGIVSIVVLAPIAEELLFRGAIQGHLMQTWKNPAWAIIASALIFGVIHGNPVQIPFAFVSGLALGWVYYRAGSLLPTILMHILNNGSSVMFFHLAGDSQATMQEMLGSGVSLAIAIGGIVTSCICVWLIQKRLTYCGGEKY